MCFHLLNCNSKNLTFKKRTKLDSYEVNELLAACSSTSGTLKHCQNMQKGKY